MSFLSFLGFGKMVEDGAKVLEFPKSKTIYPMPPVDPPKPKSKEHYRVGFDDQGMTTLTLMSNDGWGSITLSMNRSACEQLIRMLRSTYDIDDSEPEPPTDPDGGIPLNTEEKKIA